MVEIQKGEERQQRILAIWSWIFVGMETLFFILTAAMPTEADWGYFLVMSMCILALAILGMAIAITGMIKQAEDYRKICLFSAITGAVVLGIAGLFTLIMGIISVS